jgi:hypothetical protein
VELRFVETAEVAAAASVAVAQALKVEPAAG